MSTTGRGARDRVTTISVLLTALASAAFLPVHVAVFLVVASAGHLCARRVVERG